MGNEQDVLDTLVIGSGPAGIGTALALQAVPGLVHGVVERGELGESFLQWPDQVTFLTPSFTGNGFGATDLNSVHPETSPAFSLGVDYPTDTQYARYLRGVAQHFAVPVMTKTEVTAITATPEGFSLETSRGAVVARTVVWAGGEFHNPRQPNMAGGEHADHSSTKAAWTVRSGRVVIIGGYESGLDVAWCANFILIPTVGFAIASVFLVAEPLLFTGVLIYFVAPCTDWFLGFTRLAGGNTTLGAVLLPVNLITQLVLFPAFLALFARTTSVTDPVILVQTMSLWFAAPVAIAVGARTILTRLLSAAAFDRVLRAVSATIPWTIAFVIVQIFAAHIGVILGHAEAFATILIAVVIFFTLTYLLGHSLSKIFAFRYPEHALLTMTTAARNAPLMLALTMTELPGQPLIYAAIIIGMLVEFPHLQVWAKCGQGRKINP